MSLKLKRFIENISNTIKSNPVEICLAVQFCVAGCYNAFFKENEIQLYYTPVVFLVAYTLNNITINGGKWRWLYFLSATFFIPFACITIPDPVSAIYFSTLLIAIIGYLSCSRIKENTPFIVNYINRGKALFLACILSGVFCLLAISIPFSICYIFDINQGEHFYHINESIVYIGLLGIMPLLFLMFNSKEDDMSENNRFLDVALNFIYTPAIIVYAAIIYIYFIKIAIVWSLPKGNIAYIVVIFSSLAFLFRGFQPLLKRQYYNWFYNHVQLYVIPALVMYWIGTLYRISEYGFTELRVYLCLIGIFLTICAILFFSKRFGRYLYMSYVCIAMLALSAYVPGIRAKNIGIKSQTERMITAAKEVGVLTPEGKLTYISQIKEGSDSVYHTLYESFKYIRSAEGSDFMKSKYGFEDTDALFDSEIEAKIRDYPTSESDYHNNYVNITRHGDIDVSKYKVMRQLPELTFGCNGSVSVYDANDQCILSESYAKILEAQLAKIGVSADQLTRETIETNCSALLQYETDSRLFIFSSISFDKDNSDTFEIDNLCLETYLEK